MKFLKISQIISFENNIVVKWNLKIISIFKISLIIMVTDTSLRDFQIERKQ
jgi:hypothetical protein